MRQQRLLIKAERERRDAAMAAAHESGKTYRQIAEEFGLKETYVGSTVRYWNWMKQWRAERAASGEPLPDADAQDFLANFTTRTANCLSCEGLLSEADVLRYINERGGITHLLSIPNFGRKSLREVAAALSARSGKPVVTERPPPALRAIKAAISTLRRAGYKVIEPLTAGE
jgi:transposase-like protein